MTRHAVITIFLAWLSNSGQGVLTLVTNARIVSETYSTLKEPIRQEVLGLASPWIG